LFETQEKVKIDNRQKAGVYLILNRINNKKYIGSAATNRIYVKFRNHFFHGTGSKLTAAAVAKYGIENFDFFILEYFPGFVKKENLNTAHTELLMLEAKFIDLIKPEYNELFDNYKLKDNYSFERREFNGNLTQGETLTAERRQLLSEIATLRNYNFELREKLSKLASKPVILYNENGSIHSKYSGIRSMAKQFNCCNKTINKAIKEQLKFRNIGVIKLDQTKDKFTS